MATYNPNELDRFAERLLLQAATLVATSTLAGALIGLLFFLVVPRALAVLPPLAAAGIAVLIVLMFYIRGRERALMLRVQAQTILCQIANEMNTRQCALSLQLMSMHLRPSPSAPPPSGAAPEWRMP